MRTELCETVYYNLVRHCDTKKYGLKVLQASKFIAFICVYTDYKFNYINKKVNFLSYIQVNSPHS